MDLWRELQPWMQGALVFLALQVVSLSVSVVGNLVTSPTRRALAAAAGSMHELRTVLAAGKINQLDRWRERSDLAIVRVVWLSAISIVLALSGLSFTILLILDDREGLISAVMAANAITGSLGSMFFFAHLMETVRLICDDEMRSKLLAKARRRGLSIEKYVHWTPAQDTQLL